MHMNNKGTYYTYEYTLNDEPITNTISSSPSNDISVLEEYLNSIAAGKKECNGNSILTNKIEQKISYKPKIIRNEGILREGYCEECNKWFRLKTSSYWYHMNFYHGISSTGQRYPEPKTVYVAGRLQSVCSKCGDIVVLGNSKNIKLNKYNWFKHWQKRHDSN